MTSDVTHAPDRSAAIAAHLATHRARFVAFVRSQVHDDALAEDLVQEALGRALAQTETLRGEVDPWFYRSLRNAIVDHARRRGASARALEALARELDGAVAVREDAHRVCPCVLRLQKELKPEYAQALAQVEIEGQPVKAFAESHGISVSNAGVRVFRAREALRRRVVATCGECAANGCSDCSCTAGG